MYPVNKLSSREARSILHYTGFMCMLLALVMLLPIVVAVIYREYQYILPFIYSSALSGGFGLILFRFFQKEAQISLKTAMILSTGIWLVACAFAALPYYLSGNLPYIDGYFEAMSGFTTTGFSMYPDLDAVSFTMNFWRAFTQWLGGVGIIVLALTILSSSGVNIMRMYLAEGREERLAPSIRHTARIILYIYVLYTIISIILFKVAGLSVFDSIFYAFSALSTGGFTNHNVSLFFYHNIWVEIVAIIVMIIGATNFALHYTILKGNWKEYFKDIETKVAYPLMIIGSLLVALFLYNNSIYGHDLLLSLRYSVFQVVSAITTTGLQTALPSEITNQWEGMGIFILTLLMVIGAGSCSTGGGIKWLRIGIMFKGVWWQIRTFLLPKSAKIPHKIHHITDMRADETLLKLTGMFVFVYLLMYMISVIIVLLYYQNVSQVLFEVASAMSNVGLGSGLITSTSPYIVKIVFIADFWIGRLEIWPVLLFLTILSLNAVRK